MANPYPIRYTTTKDGVRIAFWEAGQGKPLIVIQNFSFSHAELEWSVPSMAAFYRELTKRYHLVRFDPRGVGMSSDPPGGWGAASEDGFQQGMTTADMCLDLEAVSEALGLDAFALLAVSVQVPVGIEFAVSHPELVSELVLWNGMGDVGSSGMRPALDAGNAIRAAGIPATDRPRFAIEETIPTEELRSLRVLEDNAVARRWDSPTKVQEGWNVESLLPEVSLPTLVVVSNGAAADLASESRHLAALIPNVQLRSLDTGVILPHFTQSAVSELDRFLHPDADQSPGFRTVVVTDIVGSTEYLQAVGDEAGRYSIREIEQRIAETAESRGGRVVKNMGDGSLVSFPSNTAALEFALDLQSGIGADGLTLRIGMSAGEPLQEDGDIHGTVVAQASRIAALAEGGGVAVADSVRQLAIGKPFDFELMGEYELKGFSQPCEIWNVTNATAP